MNQYVDDDGRLVLKRLQIASQKLPYYIQRITGDCSFYGGEVIIIDSNTKKMDIISKNISFADRASAQNVSAICPNPDSVLHTDYSKSTKTHCSVYLFAHQIERWYANNEKKLFNKGVKVIDDILSDTFVCNLEVEDEEYSRNTDMQIIQTINSFRSRVVCSPFLQIA